MPENQRAKLMSFGGDPKPNTKYKTSYVREETTGNAPLPPQELLELLQDIGVSVLPLDREVPTVETRYTGKMAETDKPAAEHGR